MAGTTGTPSSAAASSVAKTFADIIDNLVTVSGCTDAQGLVALKSGYARFLRGVDLNTRPPVAHAWSFLRPIGSISITTAGAGTYSLPADFGGLVSPFVYPYSATDSTPAIEEATPEAVMSAWRDETLTGDPFMWALIPAEYVAATGQRYKLIVAPVPDANRTWSFRYRVQATQAADTTDYPVGGPDHAETVQACSLAALEVAVGKLANAAPGTWEDAARARLAESIALDKRFMRVGTARERSTSDESGRVWR